MDRDSGIVAVTRRGRTKFRDLRDLCPRPDKGVDLITKAIREVSLDLFFQLSTVADLAAEDDVAARDERRDVGELEVREMSAELIHADPPIAEIHPAEECEVVVHAKEEEK